MSWSPQPYMSRGEEWLELTFHEASWVASVQIYETLACGALRRIRFLDPAGDWDTVWETRAYQIPDYVEGRVFAPQLSARAYKTRHIRLELETWGFTQYYAIDAVQIVEGLAPELPIFACEACPKDTFKSTSGPVACMPCSSGTSSLVGSAVCEPI